MGCVCVLSRPPRLGLPRPVAATVRCQLSPLSVGWMTDPRTWRRGFISRTARTTAPSALVGRGTAAPLCSRSDAGDLARGGCPPSADGAVHGRAGWLVLPLATATTLGVAASLPLDRGRKNAARLAADRVAVTLGDTGCSPSRAAFARARARSAMVMSWRAVGLDAAPSPDLVAPAGCGPHGSGGGGKPLRHLLSSILLADEGSDSSTSPTLSSSLS